MDLQFKKAKQKIKFSKKENKRKALEKLLRNWKLDRQELLEGRIPFSLQKKVEAMTHEWDILESLKEVPGFLPLLDAYIYPSDKITPDTAPDIKAVMYTPHYGMGSLRDFIQKAPLETLSTKNVLEISQQIARILKELKNRDITHQDIKLDNFVIKKDHDIFKIAAIDFGYAFNIYDTKAPHYNIVQGTPAYISPEKALCYMATKQNPDSPEVNTLLETIKESRIQTDLFSATLCIFELLEKDKEEFPELSAFFNTIYQLQRSINHEECFSKILLIAQQADQHCETQDIESLSSRDFALHQLVKGLRSEPSLRATPEELIEALQIILSIYE